MEKTNRKRLVAITLVLAIVMIALVGVVATVWMNDSTQTAYAENKYKVLLWLADEKIPGDTIYELLKDYRTIVRNHYESLDDVDVTVVEKSSPDGALTANEISDVQLVFIIGMKARIDRQDGQYVLDASDLLIDFVNAGGRVVLNSEYPTTASSANALFSKLAETIGGDFTISENSIPDRVMEFNTTGKPELVKDIDVDDFMTWWFAHIESPNPDDWVMKDEAGGNVAVLDQKVGNGYITVLYSCQGEILCIPF